MTRVRSAAAATGTWPATVVPVPRLGGDGEPTGDGVETVDDALQAGAHGHGADVEAGAIVGDLEGQSVALVRQVNAGDVGIGVLGDVLQGFENGEVHRCLNLGRIPIDALRAHVDADGGVAGLLRQGRRRTRPPPTGAGRRPAASPARVSSAPFAAVTSWPSSMAVFGACSSSTSPASMDHWSFNVVRWARVPPPSSASIRRRASSWALTNRRRDASISSNR